MITTKRQINSERDRFGGYGTSRVNVLPDNTDGGFVDSKDNILIKDAPKSAAQANTAPVAAPVYTTNAAASKITYIQPPAAAEVQDAPMPKYAEQQTSIYSTRDTIGTKSASAAPAIKHKQLNREDLMPSIKTRAFAEKSTAAVQNERHAEKRKEHGELTPRAKVMIVVYLVIAFALAVAVIATGVSISRSSSGAQSLVSEIAVKQSIVAEQQAQIADLTDETTVRDAAIANGMVYAGAAQGNVTRVEKVPVQNATPHTNGFDGFCDWLSSMLM